MTSLSLPRVAPWSLPLGLSRWLSRHTFGLRLTASLVAIAGAYHYSLMTLFRALGLETPLAYLGLVPMMALGLALLRARPAEDEPTIHDRQVDVIVAIPLLAAAVLIVTALPARLSSLFWVWRVDLLSLPFFVAGVVTLVFGVRALWRLRVAIGFLLLAWPLPYTAFLSRWLDGFTGLTVRALTASLRHWHVGAPAPGSDGSLFSITHAGRPFVLSVASSCSGVNGVVGFLLVGVAFTSLVRGRRSLKTLWLAAGIALIWALNVLRLLIIFWAGSSYGERVAVDGLHPVIGLLLFCAGIAVMALTMPWFGLTVPAAAPRPAQPTPPVEQQYHRIAVPRAKGAVVLLLATALFMGVANAGMRQYELVAGDLGAARLVSFATSPAAVPGYAVANVASYPWSRRFFGESSTWLRYSYYSTSGVTSSAVTADVVSSSALGRFSDYGIEACYKFHGYAVSGQHSFDLGGGVTGNLLSYDSPKQHMQWNVVYWIWPVKSLSGSGSRFERVVLLMPGRASVSVLPTGPTPRTDLVRNLGLQTYNAAAGRSRGGVDPTLDRGRQFLVDFARTLVAARPGATASTPRV